MKKENEIELTGSDYFLFAMDRLMGHSPGPDNLSRTFLELEGPVDCESFSDSLRSQSLLQWIVNVRKSRNIFFTIPSWRQDRQEKLVPVKIRNNDRASVHEPDTYTSFSRVFSPDLVDCPLFFELVQDAGTHRTCCVLNWDHTLMDAHGAEMLLEHLAVDGNDLQKERELFFGNDNNINKRVAPDEKFLRRLSFARESVHYISNASTLPIATFKARKKKSPAKDEYFSVCFSKDETKKIDSNCHKMGMGYYQSLYFLAASVMAIQIIRQKRGESDLPYFVPVPFNLRKKGCTGPAFSNNVSFLFYRISCDELVDVNRIILSLKEQMKEQVAAAVPYSYAEMMSIFRRLPLPVYSWLLSGPTKGQLASFFFSYTGECCPKMKTFLGYPIRQVTHLAPTTNIPGLSVVFMRHNNCLKATVSFRNALLSFAELEIFKEIVREHLLWGHS